ncbi:MAG: SycD/LcrH family type III secretion system chaperone [Deltaproteobacteria bacterium]|jgi:type III secretion system low calcium response chaperone LcrH/SycD|nr:SycD/LcrH family type III secretion system chaperone [Deltaproteobacteria bacterium]
MTQQAEMTKEQLDVFLEGVQSGLSVADAAGVDKDTIEAGYGLAFSLYNSGNFKDAETMFQALCIYNHLDERFWMGLAGCRQMNGKLDEAIDAYGMATLHGALQDPAPSVHAGLCYLKKGDKQNARALFDAAIEFGDPANKEHKAYHDRARAMLDLISKGA